MNKTFDMIARIAKVGMKVSMCVLLSLIAYLCICKMHQEKYISRLASGYVVDKKIIYKDPTYFDGYYTKYVLFLGGEYTNVFGESVEYAKEYFVNKETYNEYEVGDYFDSKDISKTLQEVENNQEQQEEHNKNYRER